MSSEKKEAGYKTKKPVFQGSQDHNLGSTDSSSNQDSVPSGEQKARVFKGKWKRVFVLHNLFANRYDWNVYIFFSVTIYCLVNDVSFVIS